MKLPKFSMEFACAVMLVADIWLLFIVVIKMDTLRTTVKIAADSMLRAKAPHLIQRQVASDMRQGESSTSPSTTLGTINDVVNWKTYRNEKYGFELKYPQSLSLEEVNF